MNKYVSRLIAIIILCVSLISFNFLDNHLLSSLVITACACYLSGVLTIYHERNYKLSVISYVLVLTQILLGMLLNAYSIDIILLTIINISFTIIISLLYALLSYLYIKNPKKYYINYFGELTVAIQSFSPLITISIIVVFSLIAKFSLEIWFFHKRDNLSSLIIASIAFVLLFIFLISKKYKFLKTSFLNVRKKDTIYFFFITVVTPLISIIIVYGISILFSINNIISDISSISFIGFIFGIIYMRNYAIRYLDQFQNKFNNPSDNNLIENHIIDI